MNTQVESKASINAWFYKSASNAIEWYLAGIQTELRWLQWSGPIKIDDAGEIADVSDEIVMAKNTLMRAHPKTDWQSFRSWIDDIQARAAGIVKNVENTRSKVLAKEAINIAKAISSAEVKSVAENMEQVRKEAWRIYFEKWNEEWKVLRYGNIEKMIANIVEEKLRNGGISYDAVRHTIKTVVKDKSQSIGGLGLLNLQDTETQKVLAHIQKEQEDKETLFSRELRDDLHETYGTVAANGEIMYNTLTETFETAGKWDPIDLHIMGFDEFRVMTHKKNAEGSSFHTLVVRTKKLGSSKIEMQTIICNPDELRAGALASVGILQSNGTTKIELLNVNRIQKAQIIIPVLTDRVEDPVKSLKPQSVWDKAKTSAKNTWNNWFSKKAA